LKYENTVHVKIDMNKSINIDVNMNINQVYMGTFAEPAIVDDRFSFLLTKENKLPFSISVCGCQPDSCGKRPKKIY
jgi:hypothetical protein